MCRKGYAALPILVQEVQYAPILTYRLSSSFWADEMLSKPLIVLSSRVFHAAIVSICSVLLDSAGWCHRQVRNLSSCVPSDCEKRERIVGSLEGKFRPRTQDCQKFVGQVLTIFWIATMNQRPSQGLLAGWDFIVHPVKSFSVQYTQKLVPRASSAVIIPYWRL